MKNRNVLFVTPRFPPHPGGAETYAGDLVTNLKEFGWESFVICDQHTKKISKDFNTLYKNLYIKAINISNKDIKNVNLVKWRVYQFGLLAELEKIFQSLPKIDVIHANSIEATIFSRIVADQLGVPLVATIHEHAPENLPFGKGRCKFAFQRLGIDALIAPSKFYYDRAIKWGFLQENLHTITHGVCEKRLSLTTNRNFRLEWGGEEFIYVVLIGRIYEPKGIDVLIKAINYITDMSNLRFIVVGPDGPGEYASNIRKMINEYNLSNVIKLFGPVSPDFIPDVIRSADIIVAPSNAEGFGLTVVEAMIIGKPVIASNVGGLKEIIVDGKNGIHFTTGNYKELADKINMLVNDDSLKSKILKYAKDFAKENFSAIRMAKETSDIYNLVC